MELLDRYINAVGRHLPRKKRADIQAELRSSLVDSLEARVGGEPSEEDTIAILREFGSPEKVAASYWPESQYLIGPRLFPLFKTILGIVITVLVSVQLALLFIAAVFNPESLAVMDSIGGIFGSIISTFGMIVFVFAILQRLDVQPESKEEEWNPANLPAVDETDSVKAGSLIAEITIDMVLAAVLIYFPGRIILSFSLESSQVIINPVLIQYIPLLVLSLVLAAGLDVYLLWRGRWEVPSRWAKIGVNLFGLYVLALLLAGHNNWLAANGAAGFFNFLERLPEGGSLPTDKIQIIVMQAFRMAFVVAIIAVGFDTFQQGYRLIRRMI